MTGIETRVDGICARCSMEAIGLIVVAGEGWCESCIGRDPAPAGGGVHLAEAAAMLDRCPTCGFTLRCGLCGGSPAPAGAARWVVHVPEQPPSQNAFKAGLFPPKGATFAQLRKLMLGQAGSYGRLVETWRKLLADKLLAAACWKATGRRRVVFTRLMGPRNKAFDAFNAVGGIFSRPERRSLRAHSSHSPTSNFATSSSSTSAKRLRRQGKQLIRRTGPASCGG